MYYIKSYKYSTVIYCLFASWLISPWIDSTNGFSAVVTPTMIPS